MIECIYERNSEKVDALVMILVDMLYNNRIY